MGMTLDLLSLGFWIGGCLVFALLLACVVEPLLSRRDFEDYTLDGGHLGYRAFRLLRRRFKRLYFRSHYKAHLEHRVGELPPSLGAYIHRHEKDTEAN